MLTWEETAVILTGVGGKEADGGLTHESLVRNHPARKKSAHSLSETSTDGQNCSTGQSIERRGLETYRDAFVYVQNGKVGYVYLATKRMGICATVQE